MSRTVLERVNPFTSSQRDSASMSTALPGAAEKLSISIHLRGGRRCTNASAVVHSTRGFSTDERVRASRDSTVIRRDVIAPFGETRS